jgi:elongation factor P--beta-lysine ligase
MTEDTNQSNGALPVRSMDEILAEAQRHEPEYALVECPELGSSFKVRGLSRAEVLYIARVSTNPKTGQADQQKADIESALHGIVEPKINEGQYRALCHLPHASPALARIQTKISELSTGVAPNPDGDAAEDAIAAAEARFRP